MSLFKPMPVPDVPAVQPLTLRSSRSTAALTNYCGPFQTFQLFQSFHFVRSRRSTNKRSDTLRLENTILWDEHAEAAQP
jgi:hypothetical protein